MIAGVHWSGVFESAGGIAGVVALLLVPASIIFHRKVIRPLRWVLGVSAENSPTGQEILPVPKQLAELRSNQVEVQSNQDAILKQLSPNHGNSLYDKVKQTHAIATRTERTLNEHLVKSAENEAEIWRAIATKKDIEIPTG